MTYSEGFIEHYILPLLYPTDLTRQVQVILGSLVVTVNVAIYWYVFQGRRLAHGPGHNRARDKR